MTSVTPAKTVQLSGRAVAQWVDPIDQQEPEEGERESDGEQGDDDHEPAAFAELENPGGDAVPGGYPRSRVVVEPGPVIGPGVETGTGCSDVDVPGATRPMFWPIMGALPAGWSPR